ncbi:hypothetical protein GALMADRAFT_239869 [Galerina marginata CBS 339.88]|uniref:F-box domain-containing protein n=1 Tax=Galerina marginata (strain CBS 339.88) TaxID=685588 RepID=A0A067TEQ6_GALM3|nr:hypothetical protein GALMADRAFT_239869 [Galerina marginata CBS 339.88]
MSDIHRDEARLMDIKDRIFHVDRRIQLLKGERQFLAEQNAKLAANIAVQRVQYAPMRDLLPELCGIIFALCTEAECSLSCSASHCEFQKSYPIVLASVCQRWRAMVVRNPSMWTTLHLRPTSDALAEMKRARLFLLRSADMPLFITICPANLRMGLSPQKMNGSVLPLIRLLIPYFDRIQFLKAHLATEILAVLFPPREIIQMPQVEELSLLVDDQHVGASQLALLDSPKLHILHVRDMTPFVDLLENTLSSLHTLTVAKCHKWKLAPAFPSMLAKCTDLRSCSITFPVRLFFVELAPIMLPELQSLTLEWPFLFEPCPIFRALRTPRLRSLHITHLSPELVLPPHTLSSLKGLIQSAPGLTSLTVTGCNLLTQDESTTILQEANALERLEIINCQRGDRFIVPLCPHNPKSISAWVCPKLKHITISGLQDSDVRPIVKLARIRSDRHLTTATNHGGAYLQELMLFPNNQNLTRQAKLLMFSGLFSVQKDVTMSGPFGSVFGNTSQAFG